MACKRDFFARLRPLNSTIKPEFEEKKDIFSIYSGKREGIHPNI
jgi:hypothetical protein